MTRAGCDSHNQVHAVIAMGPALIRARIIKALRA